MKLQIASLLAVVTVGALTGSALPVAAKNSPATQNSVSLSYGVPDVLKLAQAKLGDDIIVAYIQNTGLSYGDLAATEIVYLHQQGVSPRVITTMLSQRTRLSEAAALASTQSAVARPASPIASGQTDAIAPVHYSPPVAYVQPSPTVIYMRDSSPRLVDYGIYPSYGCYPSYGHFGYSYRRVSFSFGFGGYHGGGHYGGGFHSGGVHGYGGHHR